MFDNVKIWIVYVKIQIISAKIQVRFDLFALILHRWFFIFILRADNAKEGQISQSEVEFWKEQFEFWYYQLPILKL